MQPVDVAGLATITPFAFASPLRFPYAVTRALAGLLGPCFKTGRVENRPTCPRFSPKMVQRLESRTPPAARKQTDSVR
jgi:hypothetical protein